MNNSLLLLYTVLNEDEIQSNKTHYIFCYFRFSIDYKNVFMYFSSYGTLYFCIYVLYYLSMNK